MQNKGSSGKRNKWEISTVCVHGNQPYRVPRWCGTRKVSTAVNKKGKRMEKGDLTEPKEREKKKKR